MNDTQLYIDHLSKRHFAARTIEEYFIVLERFSKYIGESGKEVADTKLKDVRDYLVFLLETNKKISVNHHLIIIRSFFNWMVDRRGLASNPVATIKLLKHDETIPVFLLQQELQYLYQLVDQDNKIKTQDVTMLDVLVGTGMRTTELCNLKTTDFFTDSGTGFFKLRVTKGGNEREVAMPDYTKDSVLAFMSAIKLRGYKQDWVFPNSFGNQLTRQAVYNRIENIVKKVKSHKKGAHMLRHTFATLAMNRDVPMKAIQMQLGHKDPNTTAGYSHVDIERMKKVFNNAHPKGKGSSHKEI